jgi:hypothetical protein
MSKKQYGQYYTTNYSYILQNLNIPNKITDVIEPFAGNGDLKQFIDKYKYNINNVEYYDIDPKQEYIIQKDTLLNPPSYKKKFIITNPPYLARNKSKNKELFDKYNINDLYKCLIINLINDVCLGGILIIPLNFWSSIRKQDIKLRKDFLKYYNIILLNIFEERVFIDTSYTICAFQFELKNIEEYNNNDINNNQIHIDIYPSKKKLLINLNIENNYIIGGEIYKLNSNIKYNITRLTKKNISKKNTNLLIKCIDDNKTNQIKLSYIEDDKLLYIDNTPNLSSRTYATLVIEPEISIELQKKLVHKFNIFLNEYRNKYNSLFLTNYRESKDIARKRISFELVYSIVLYLLNDLE